MTEARVNLEVVPAVRMVAVLHFQRLAQAIDAVKFILKYQPTAVEIIDAYALQLARANPEASRLVGHFISGDPEAVLMVEFSAATQPRDPGPVPADGSVPGPEVALLSSARSLDSGSPGDCLGSEEERAGPDAGNEGRRQALAFH